MEKIKSPTANKCLPPLCVTQKNEEDEFHFIFQTCPALSRGDVTLISSTVAALTITLCHFECLRSPAEQPQQQE